MNIKSGFSILFFSIALVCFQLSSALAQSECTDGESVSPSQILNTTSEVCCSKATPGAQNKCLRKGIASLRRIQNIIGTEVFKQSRSSIITLRAASCNLQQVASEACTAALSTTTTEALTTIDESACDSRLQSSRLNKLKSFNRKVKKASRYIGKDYASVVRADIKALKNSNQCGLGGEQGSVNCRVVNPRDGATIGNVYKLSDHAPHSPVFITHNGARSGSAITTNGALIAPLSYTGLGNHDGRALRHHYRFSQSCSSLPSRFYIKLGGTCYEIDDRCGRID